MSSDKSAAAEDLRGQAGIIDYFRREILAQNEYRHGGRLPSVREVAAQFGCSTKTAHRAMTTLVSMGLARATPREGYAVTYNVQTLATLRASVSGVRKRGFMRSPSEGAVIDFAGMKKTWAALADRFNIETEAQAPCRIGRVLAQERVIGYRTSWFHPDMAALVPELLDVTFSGSIARIEQVTGKTVVLKDDDFCVDMSSQFHVDMFGLPKGDPVLIVQATRVFAEDGVLVEFGHSVYPRNIHLALEYEGD